MPRSPKVGKTALLSFAIRLAVIALFVFAVPVTPSFAQASGHVRVKFVKAGLLVGGGTGSGVLTYRDRNYLFRGSGLSLGITVGASVSRLEGWASGIRQVSDFAGTYSSVGAAGALVGGAGGVHLTNENGIMIALRGPKAGMEFVANISKITISMK